MERKSQIRPTENGVEISINVLFPFTNKVLSEINLDKIYSDRKDFVLKVLESYRDYLITVLRNRMNTCVNNLFAHREDVVFNDGNEIVYSRKDGSTNSFNVPSYMAMQDCMYALEYREFNSIADNKVWCDQLIKAICNDRDTNKEDAGTIKFSNLISVLCECHAINN